MKKDSYGQLQVAGSTGISSRPKTINITHGGRSYEIPEYNAVDLVHYRIIPCSGGPTATREVPWHIPAPITLDQAEINSTLQLFGAELLISGSDLNDIMNASAGGATMIKILASDFIPNDDDLSYNVIINDDTQRFAVQNAGDPSPLYYFTDIPRGTQAEGGEFYTYNTRDSTEIPGPTGETNITIYEGFINFNNSEPIKYLNSTNQGTSTLAFTFDEPIAWSPTNFIVVKYIPKLNTDRLYGGFLALGATGP
jgi:hypothetical protein